MRRATTLALLLGSLAQAAPAVLVLRNGEQHDAGFYAGTRDVTIARWPGFRPDQNQAAGQRSTIDGFPEDSAMLIRFDLSTVPRATVLSARLTWTVLNPSNDYYPVYEVLTDWKHSEVTWFEAKAGVPWAVPGALGAGSDRAAIPLGAHVGLTAGTLTYPVTGPTLQAIQRWVDGGPNYGVIAQDYEATEGLDWVPCEATDGGAMSLELSLQLDDGGARSQVVPCQDVPIGRGGSGLDRMDLGADADEAVALLRFDLSPVPAGAVLRSAELRVQVTAGSVDRGLLFGLRVPWTEGAMWTSPDGGAAQWEIPGAHGPTERDPQPFAALLASSAGPLTVSFPDAGLALIADWLSGARPNHGFSIEADGGDMFRFRDSETSAMSERPALVLTFDLVSTADAGTADAGTADAGTSDAGTTGLFASVRATWNGPPLNLGQRAQVEGELVGPVGQPVWLRLEGDGLHVELLTLAGKALGGDPRHALGTSSSPTPFEVQVRVQRPSSSLRLALEAADGGTLAETSVALEAEEPRLPVGCGCNGHFPAAALFASGALALRRRTGRGRG